MHGLDPSMHSIPPLPSAFLCFILLLWRLLSLLLCVSPLQHQSSQVFHLSKVQIYSVQFSRSVMSDSLQPHELQHAKPPCPSRLQLPESIQTHVHQVGDAIQPSHPLSSPSPPALNFSQHQGLFKWVSFLNRWPKYWSFGFNISPSSEHPGLIFFRMDWLDLLAVQGTLKSLLQRGS